MKLLQLCASNRYDEREAFNKKLRKQKLLSCVYKNIGQGYMEQNSRQQGEEGQGTH